ncbi:hypothetical protein [Streptomyces wuyuanensis]
MTSRVIDPVTLPGIVEASGPGQRSGAFGPRPVQTRFHHLDGG